MKQIDKGDKKVNLTTNKCYCPKTEEQEGYCRVCVTEMVRKGNARHLGQGDYAYRFEGTPGPWFMTREIAPKPNTKDF